MANNEKSDVSIRTDQVTESFGQHAYTPSASPFDEQKTKISVIVIAGIFIIVCISMSHTKKTITGLGGEKSPLPKEISQDSPSALNPRIFTERDLRNSNVLSKEKVRRRDRIAPRPEIQIISFGSANNVPIGSELNAVLVSGATDGLVKAKLSKPLIQDGEVILQSGTNLLGRGRSGDERLFVEFTKAISPTGETIAFRAQAFDESDRIQGLKGAVVGRRTKKMAGAVAFGMMGGLAEGFKDSGGSIYLPRRPSARDAALNGASRAALDQSKAYLDEMKNSSNIIEVRSGQEILVIVDEPKTRNEGG